VRVLPADQHLQRRRVGRLTQQAQQDDMLLERLEHRADRQREVLPEPGEVGRTGEHQPLLAVLDEGFQQRGDDGGEQQRPRIPPPATGRFGVFRFGE